MLLAASPVATCHDLRLVLITCGRVGKITHRQLPISQRVEAGREGIGADSEDAGHTLPWGCGQRAITERGERLSKRSRFLKPRAETQSFGTHSFSSCTRTHADIARYIASKYPSVRLGQTHMGSPPLRQADTQQLKAWHKHRLSPPRRMLTYPNSKQARQLAMLTRNHACVGAINDTTGSLPTTRPAGIEPEQAAVK